MDFNLFRQYPSNTVVSTCNNFILKSDCEREVTGRIFYKVRKSGKLAYRFFFCNAVDSTFDNGSVSYANLPGDKLDIISAYAGCWEGEPADFDGNGLMQLTFNGSKTYTAAPSEFYCSDECELDIKENCYLVFQWTVKGKDIAYTPDKTVSCYTLVDGKWKNKPDFPQPFLIGAKTGIDKLMIFLGDSITQGLGTDYNKYNHWVAYISEGLPESIAVWNLGLGFGRAQDAASDGVWLAKAKNADLVNICFGVNDLLQGRSVESIKSDIAKIVITLREAGVKVGLFTIPPFDYDERITKMWRELCDYIKNDLGKYAEYVFDTSKYWGLDAPNDNKSRFGGHPSPEGCKLLADGFLKAIDIPAII